MTHRLIHHCSVRALVSLSLLAVGTVAALGQHVIIADKFERTTEGARNGTLSFVPSTIPYGYALQAQGNQPTVRYTFNGWSTQQGTLECMVFVPAAPHASPAFTFLTLQWFANWSNEPSGYIGQLGIADPNEYPGHGGELVWSGYNGNNFNPVFSAAGVPLNEWVHVAVAWSTSGTSMYMNDVEVFHTSTDLYPGFNPTSYLFIGVPNPTSPSNPTFWIDNVVLCDFPEYPTGT